MAFKLLVLSITLVMVCTAANTHNYRRKMEESQDRMGNSDFEMKEQFRYENKEQIEKEQEDTELNQKQQSENEGYDFAYTVQDPTTGDFKTQEESRRNGDVRGQYSWVDPEGYRQIVDYHADDRTGFQSNIRREPTLNTKINTRFQNYANYPRFAPLYAYDTLYAPIYSSASRQDYNQQNEHDRKPQTEVRYKTQSANYQYKH